MDIPHCEHLVTQYLLGQDWQLADPRALAHDLWQDISGLESSPQDPVKFIQLQTAFRYAVVLHDTLRQPPGDRNDRAWKELKAWLTKNAARITADRAEQDEIVQETLIELHRRLSAQPLDAPRALWTYLFQMMRNRRADYYRHRTAVKRGDDTLLSLEDLNDEEHLPATHTATRDPESDVTEQDLQERLRAFFHQYLPTDLQRQVAEAHFIEGRSPKEIAALLGKRPHEIRLVKSRVVQTLRNLPPDAHRALQDVLGKPPFDWDTSHE